MTTSASTPTTAPEGRLQVAVGVLRRCSDGAILVAERSPARHAGGGFEFPGGKIEPGEGVGQALARELNEELGIQLITAQRLLRLRHDYVERRVELFVQVSEQWQGAPSGREGQALHWLAPAQLDPAAFPAANRPIIAALWAPARLRVTPPIEAPGAIAEWAGRIAAAVHAGDWVQLRQSGLASGVWCELVRTARARLTAASAPRLLLNTDAGDPLLAETGCGLHLTAERTGRLDRRPPGVPVVGSSAHDADELVAAERLGADFAVVGPVAPTPSHPGAPGSGWDGLAAWSACTALPIYAIGGLGPADVAVVREHGAVGVAGISAFWGG